MAELFLAGAALGSILVALYLANRGLDRYAARIHADVYTAMWGTRPDGRPRPRCRACLYSTQYRPDGLDHVPGCWAYVPDTIDGIGDDR